MQTSGQSSPAVRSERYLNEEKGSIDTPLGLTIKNQAGRFSLSIDVIYRVPKLQISGAHVRDWLQEQIRENVAFAHEYGIDKPEIRD